MNNIRIKLPEDAYRALEAVKERLCNRTGKVLSWKEAIHMIYTDYITTPDKDKLLKQVEENEEYERHRDRQNGT